MSNLAKECIYTPLIGKIDLYREKQMQLKPSVEFSMITNYRVSIVKNEKNASFLSEFVIGDTWGVGVYED